MNRMKGGGKESRRALLDSRKLSELDRANGRPSYYLQRDEY